MAYLLLVGMWLSVKRSLKSSQRALCYAPRGVPSQTNLESLEFYWEPGVLLGAMAQSFCSWSIWSLPLKGLHIFVQLVVLVGLGSPWLEDFCLFSRSFSGGQSHSSSSLYRAPRQPLSCIGPCKPQYSLFWEGGQNQQGFTYCLCKDIYLNPWVICCLH